MLYIIPTKNGIGVEIWGTREDLDIFYSFIGQFWNYEEKLTQKGFENRDNLISSFSYEIRKAKEEQRLKRNKSHFSFEEQKYFGAQISWVHFLFSLVAIKYNMRYYPTNKLDISQLLNLEFWLEKAMNDYDKITAEKLVGFIEDGLHGGNEYIYQYMRSLDVDFLQLGGGKKSFRKLPDLLKRGIFYTEEYKDYENFLKTESQKLNCSISDLEINDDDFDYDKIAW
ncbi:DUF6904 family protein [Flavobacterium sp. JP2137]|uniref:DUF6904 family protein n=1 Tax=Flavobacterium sp. JP2137 TaxID=3414510 RepID=UPI003D2FEF5C